MRTRPSASRAYRKLAMRYHPDRNPDSASAEEKFKEASEAYGVLSDPDKRRVYDQFGHEGLSGRAAPPGGFDPNNLQDVFGDIFGEFFGGGRTRASRGNDLQYELEVGFADAVFGCTRDIVLLRTGALRTLRRLALRARQPSDDLPDLRRAWPSARHPRILLCLAHVQRVPRHRPSHLRSMHQLPWGGACPSAAQALDQHPRRSGRRHADPSHRRRRRRRARGPAR